MRGAAHGSTAIAAAAAAGKTDENRRDAEFGDELVVLIPFLQRLARRLCRNRDLADDMAQNALAKAWEARNSFRAGTNLKAWLSIILRNGVYSDYRHRRREVGWRDEFLQEIPAVEGGQAWAVELRQTLSALPLLSAEQREAILAIAVDGLSYTELAAMQGCPVGTAKSRVGRGRTALRSWMESQALPQPG
jgi:RNA polymerase sigma-70 factor (ECF subfamily)